MKGSFQWFARNGLARRTFVVLAASVAVIVLGVVALVSAWNSRYVHEEVEREAAAQAKQYGLGVFQRLELAALALASAAPDATTMAPYFERIDLTNDVDLGARMGSKPVELQLRTDADGSVAVHLLYRTLRGILVGRVARDFLWQPDAIPSHLGVTVLGPSGLSLFSRSPDAALEGTPGEETRPSAAWNLFLRERFAADGWRIQLSSSAGERGEALARLRFSLLVTLLPLLAGMAWLASVLIRRSHAPLERLIAATHRVGSGRFDAQVAEVGDVDSRALIRSFNEMTDRIARQWRALQLWASIDESILRAADLGGVASVALRDAFDVLECDGLTLLLFDADARDAVMWRVEGAELKRTGLALPSLPAPLAVGRPVALANGDPDWQAWQALCACTAPPLALQLTAIRQESVVRGLIVTARCSSSAVEPDCLVNQQHLSERLAVALAKLDRDEALVRSANLDELTQLSNRRHLQAHLTSEIARSVDSERCFAFLFLDLDRFKLVNDAIGHAVGDSVLQAVAAKLRACLPADHFIARLGGDEFTVVMPDASDRQRVVRETEALLAALADPIAIGDHVHIVSASIGIAVYPHDGCDVVTLMRKADVAMYRAKRSTTNRYAFYDATMSTDALQQVILEADLRSALANGELATFYQPQVDMRTGRVVGAEALLRWNHPRLGLLSPDRFLTIAEQTGMIVPIGEQVMDAVCRQYREWLNEGLTLDSIAVNASVAQLLSPQFLAVTAAALDAHHIPRGVLEIEITESAIAHDIEALARILAQARELGARIAIDDFGVGYSSLTYLQRLPFDTLKIDRSFMPVADAPESGSLCLVIIEMAKTLRKALVAEGVETAQQAQFLRNAGCEIAQGYHYARALTSDAFQDFAGARAELRDIG